MGKVIGIDLGTTNCCVAVASRSPFSAIGEKDNASRSRASSPLQLRHGDIIHVAVKGIEPGCYNTLS
jgi:RNase H-fold protein (predicted Holliday junction resolvase)